MTLVNSNPASIRHQFEKDLNEEFKNFFNNDKKNNFTWFSASTITRIKSAFNNGVKSLTQEIHTKTNIQERYNLNISEASMKEYKKMPSFLVSNKDATTKTLEINARLSYLGDISNDPQKNRPNENTETFDRKVQDITIEITTQHGSSTKIKTDVFTRNIVQEIHYFLSRMKFESKEKQEEVYEKIEQIILSAFISKNKHERQELLKKAVHELEINLPNKNHFSSSIKLMFINLSIDYLDNTF